MRGIALLLVLLAVGCATPPPKVVLLGDSITHGMVSGKEGGASYAELLAASFGESVELHNVACGGVTVALWLNEAKPILCDGEAFHPNLFQGRLVEHLPAEVVVVLLGTNDSLLKGGEITPELYREQLRTLTRELTEHGAGRVLLLSPPFINVIIKATLLLRDYGKEIAKLCAEREEVVCGPDLFRLLAADDFAGLDLHPSGRGHAKIAVAVEAALRPLIGLEAAAPGS